MPGARYLVAALRRIRLVVEWVDHRVVQLVASRRSGSGPGALATLRQPLDRPGTGPAAGGAAPRGGRGRRGPLRLRQLLPSRRTGALSAAAGSRRPLEYARGYYHTQGQRPDPP